MPDDVEPATAEPPATVKDLYSAFRTYRHDAGTGATDNEEWEHAEAEAFDQVVGPVFHSLAVQKHKDSVALQVLADLVAALDSAPYVTAPEEIALARAVLEGVEITQGTIPLTACRPLAKLLESVPPVSGNVSYEIALEHSSWGLAQKYKTALNRLADGMRPVWPC
jgi:hypothetical protein